LSEQFLQRSLFTAVDTMLCVIISTALTPKCTQPAKYGQIILIVAGQYSLSSVFPCRLRITSQLRSSRWHCWQNGRYLYKMHLATL